jgi:transposase
MMRNLIGILWGEWKTVEQQIDELTDRLEQIAASDADCCRIRQIPGIGPIVATAIGCRHQQRRSVPQGPRFCSMAWISSKTVLDRR